MGRAGIMKRHAKDDKDTGASSVSARHVPSRDELADATVLRDPETEVDDGKVHLYILPYMENLNVYGEPFAEGPGVSMRAIF